jgi:AraC-like DNA-binding protein
MLTIQHSKKPYLTKEERKTFVFIKYLLFALLYAYLNFFATLILPLIAHKIDFSASLNSGMLILAGAIILYISFSILLSPELLFDIKEEKIKNSGNLKVKSFEESLVYINDLENKMNEHRFYLKENFSSQDVLTHFDLPRNKLDELLIHVKGITFAEWLNSFRINYAKTLLISNKEFTIDAISVMAGFSSRSAFYAAFKHLTKTTPTEFIRQTRKEIEEK